MHGMNSINYNIMTMQVIYLSIFFSIKNVEIIKINFKKFLLMHYTIKKLRIS